MYVPVLRCFTPHSPQGSKRVVMVDSVSKFSEFIEPQEIKLPQSTMEFEQDGKVKLLSTRGHPLSLPHPHSLLVIA